MRTYLALRREFLVEVLLRRGRRPLPLCQRLEHGKFGVVCMCTFFLHVCMCVCVYEGKERKLLGGYRYLFILDGRFEGGPMLRRILLIKSYAERAVLDGRLRKRGGEE